MSTVQPTAPGETTACAPVVVTPKASANWAAFNRRRTITVPLRPFLRADDRVFTMGSCFAREVRKALGERGMTVLPDYRAVAIDPERNGVDQLPEAPHLNYYNTFTVRQEFERLAGLWRQDPDDYWTVPSARWPEGMLYQHPYRRQVLGRTPEDLRAVNAALDTAMAQGFADATTFLLTFGMTEVFVSRANGKVVWQRPGHAEGLEQSRFHASGFEENLANVRRTVELILAAKPQARIVLTVSPVPLSRTFTDNDVCVANTQSKAILRAVVGQVASEFEQAIYFPSYEIVTVGGSASFREDGRHVRPEVVREVMSAFVEAHVEGAAGLTPTP